MKTASMLFVDDHPLFRDGLRRGLADVLPEVRVETVPDRHAALDRLERDDGIDLCLSDQRLSDGEGLDLIAQVRRRFPTVAVGILSADVGPSLAAKVRGLGGIACLSKERDCEAVASGIRRLLAGEEVFDVGLSQGRNPLSARRCDIVRMAAEGLPDKQIGLRLAITESAVRNHWCHIFGRLGAANRTEAVMKALQQRFI